MSYFGGNNHPGQPGTDPYPDMPWGGPWNPYQEFYDAYARQEWQQPYVGAGLPVAFAPRMPSADDGGDPTQAFDAYAQAQASLLNGGHANAADCYYDPSGFLSAPWQGGGR